MKLNKVENQGILLEDSVHHEQAMVDLQYICSSSLNVEICECKYIPNLPSEGRYSLSLFYGDQPRAKPRGLSP